MMWTWFSILNRKSSGTSLKSHGLRKLSEVLSSLYECAFHSSYGLE